MLNTVTIERHVDGRVTKYADVLDAAEALSNGDYGSGINAIAVMVRQSHLFKKYQRGLQEGQGRNQRSNVQSL